MQYHKKFGTIKLTQKKRNRDNVDRTKHTCPPAQTRQFVHGHNIAVKHETK